MFAGSAPADVLKEIVTRGAWRAVVQTQGPPVSFVDENGERSGFAIEFVIINKGTYIVSVIGGAGLVRACEPATTAPSPGADGDLRLDCADVLRLLLPGFFVSPVGPRPDRQRPDTVVSPGYRRFATGLRDGVSSWRFAPPGYEA